MSVCSLSNIDQSRLSGFWLLQSVRRAKEAEHIGRDAILEPIGYRLVLIYLF